MKVERERRPVMVTNDLDGVHFMAPIPMETTLKLLLRKFSIPEGDPPFEPYQQDRSLIGSLTNTWSFFSHSIRPMTADSLITLARLHEIAAFQQRDIAARASGQ